MPIRQLLAAVFVWTLVGFLSSSGVFTALSTALIDSRWSVLSTSPSGAVGVIEIDARSLSELGQWPWPRHIYADAVKRLTDAGANAVVLDVDLSSPADAENDKALEAAIAEANGAVFLAAFRQVTHGSQPHLVATLPLPGFAANAWTGLVDVMPDADGKVRRISEAAFVDGKLMTSIPALLANRAATAGVSRPIDFGIDISRIERFSFVDLLQGRVPPEELKGRTFIVGSTAT